MKKRFLPSPAMLVALFAVMLASISPATAAVKKLIGTNNIKNGAVTTAKIKKGAVTRDRLAADAIQAGAKGDTGLQGAKGDTGSQGLKGDQGIKGDQGLAGTARAFAYVSENGTLDQQHSTPGATARKAAGRMNGVYCLSFPGITFSGGLPTTGGAPAVTVDYSNSGSIDIGSDKLAVASFGSSTTCPINQLAVITVSVDLSSATAAKDVDFADTAFSVVIP